MLQICHETMSHCTTTSRRLLEDGKKTRLEEERGERSHLHQEGVDACYQPGWGVPPSSTSLREAVVLRDVVSWHILSSDQESSLDQKYSPYSHNQMNLYIFSYSLDTVKDNNV